ncbi:MAG TPA: LysM peptidoglycan-binding domain-containing M23 family metallopeptidase [Spirochaetia bacterium]|nr:LysM peptidoglycan-binding domain-containing M23 family metallopeptidase [Spirochaetia bacterium]
MAYFRDSALRLLSAVLPRLRAPFVKASALMIVATTVTLATGSLLPFPRPGETVLYDPSDWSMLIRGGGPAGRPEPVVTAATVNPQTPLARGEAIGGFSLVQPSVQFLLYRVKPGDTITGIAQKLGLNPDTVSSLNRSEGRGVHNISVGEKIRIPTQDGIFVPLDSDFDALCRKKGVSPEEVLAANNVTRSDLVPGKLLFFPGVQHTGYEYSLSLGVAVSNPLPSAWETSTYGYRSDPFTGQRRKHNGVDLAAPYGSPVRSATEGVVRDAGWDDVLGNYVEIRGQLGYSYVYGHMSRILVQPGTRVVRGSVLGAVGATGYATGPHLHFEVRRYGVPQNPALFVSGLR